MLKKFVKVFLVTMFLLSLIVPNALASEDSESKKEMNYTPKNSEVTITEEKEPSVDVNTLPNAAETIFSPQSANTGGFQTYGLTFARGNISCYTVSSNAYCPWNIQVGGDLITYSNVIVYLERNEGFLNGGWERYSTFNFRYPVNIATATIRNEASFKLPRGSYRVKLGGNFTTAKNGIYSAVSNGPSYFEVN